MKNNTLIFLGFLVICLVNLTAQKTISRVKTPAPSSSQPAETTNARAVAHGEKLAGHQDSPVGL